MTLVVVSDNSAPAVEAYLTQHGLRQSFAAIVGREFAAPALLKPNPYFVAWSIRMMSATAEDCTLIGDSVSDIQAARAAGCLSIGYANKPGKANSLHAAGPDAITDTMTGIASAPWARMPGPA
jgi:phosphoglycolate phosphatase-like HAD superfamily hydrolase